MQLMRKLTALFTRPRMSKEQRLRARAFMCGAGAHLLPPHGEKTIRIEVVELDEGKEDAT